MAEPSAVNIFVQRLGILLLRTLRQARQLHVQITAASLAFLSLLAIVPVFSIVVSVFAALPLFDSLRDALQGFLARHLFPPAISDTVLEYVNGFAEQANRLSMVGAALFFATAVGCLLTIDRALNRIWGAARFRPLAQRLMLYGALLTLAPLVLGVSIAANGMVVRQWLGGGTFEEVQQLLFSSLTWLVTGMVLLLLYRLVPNTTVRWREAAIAAVVTTLLVEALRSALGIYLANFSTYTIIYGAFSVLPVLLMWLFMAWLLVLLGAVLASNLRYWGQAIAPGRASRPSDVFTDALAIVRRLVEREPRGLGPGLSARSWLPLFEGDGQRAERAVRLAASRGYVDRMVAVGHEVDSDDAPVWAEYWSLTRPAGEMTLGNLFAGVWGGPLEGVPAPGLEMPLDRWVAMVPRRAAGPAPVDAAGSGVPT